MTSDSMSVYTALTLITPFLVVVLALLVVLFNAQTWKKMDRVAMMLYKEKEALYNKIDSLMFRVGELSGTVNTVTTIEKLLKPSEDSETP